MVEKSVISVALRRRLFIVQIDVPECAPNIFQNYSTNTPRLKRVFYVTRLYAAAGIGRYRLINVGVITLNLRPFLEGSYPWSVESIAKSYPFFF